MARSLTRRAVTLAEIVIGALILGFSGVAVMELVRTNTVGLQVTEIEAVARGLAADVLERYAAAPRVLADRLGSGAKDLQGVPLSWRDVLEHVTNDLSRMVPLGVPFRHDPKKPAAIGFWVIDPEHTAGTRIGVRAVGYRLEARDTLLFREHGAEESPVGPSPLTTIAFLPHVGATGPMVRVQLAVGRTPDDPPGPPIPHTFLVRPANPRTTPGLKLEPLSGFMRDEPPSGEPAPLPRVW